ncbi:SAM-dependent methyltransferase [Methanolacinia paynteri]|uniref:SAM-dependent methyltransferase n=1 Tax=Methanolacinia paynteri TaxID=230356 RepID=UPI00064F618C|nr:methyltransferase domain-containing protein [Methanolacinia paynteri]
MNFQDLVTISQGPLGIMNPFSQEKALLAGEMARLSEGMTVIDFGCGNGTLLGIWGRSFGVCGTGIEIREEACSNAGELLAKLDLSENIHVFLADASLYDPEDETYNVAVSFGASQIWGGIPDAISSMKSFLKPDGIIIIGERYWKKDSVAAEFSREWPEIMTEYEILQSARENGYDITRVIRSSEDEWDDYESSIWENCLDWMTENPDHPEKDEVYNYFLRIQDEYLAYGREYIGWAAYILVPSLSP